MRLGVVDGTAFSVMTGVGEAYFAAFALAIGMSEVSAGLVGPVPQFAAACAMLFVHGVILRLRSLKRWVVLLASIQAMVFAPLTAIAVFGGAPAWVVFSLLAVYWTGTVGGGAAWNAWAAALYPSAIRARYFGWRTRLQQFGVLVGLVAGGAILQTSGGGGAEGRVYAVLFALAGLARGVSVLMLSLHSDPVPIPDGFRDVGLREFAGGLRGHRGGRLLLAMLMLQGAAMFSAPFFAPYMLAQLEMSYGSYMALIGTMVLTKSLALPHLGGLIKRVGARPVLIAGGFGIVPMSIMWVGSEHIAYLLFCQVCSGVVWAAYELASFLLLFDTIPAGERVGLLARYNLINTLVSALGAGAGAVLLGAMGTGQDAYLTVFAVSSGLRLAAVPLLLRVERGAAAVTHASEIPLRPIAVGPGGASMDRPVLAGLEANPNTGAADEPAGDSHT